MSINKSLLSRSNLLKVFYIGLFYVFISPYSISFQNQGVSVNYLFVFFPIIALVIKKQISFPPKSIFWFIALLSIIFLFGFLSESNNQEFFRRSASFVLFMSVFTLVFVKLDSDMLQSFKLAIILWAFVDASARIIEFIQIDGNAVGFYAKGILGSQRIGFVYLMGLWITATLSIQNNVFKIAKFIVLFILLTGIFITYSRSSIFGLAMSTAVYFIYYSIILFKYSSSIKTALIKIFVKVAYFFTLLILIFVFFHGSTNYYLQTIFKFVISTQLELLEDDELSLYTSEKNKTQLQIETQIEQPKYQLLINIENRRADLLSKYQDQVSQNKIKYSEILDKVSQDQLNLQSKLEAKLLADQQAEAQRKLEADQQAEAQRKLEADQQAEAQRKLEEEDPKLKDAIKEAELLADQQAETQRKLEEEDPKLKDAIKKAELLAEQVEEKRKFKEKNNAQVRELENIIKTAKMVYITQQDQYKFELEVEIQKLLLEELNMKSKIELEKFKQLELSKSKLLEDSSKYFSKFIQNQLEEDNINNDSLGSRVINLYVRKIKDNPETIEKLVKVIDSEKNIFRFERDYEEAERIVARNFQRLWQAENSSTEVAENDNNIINAQKNYATVIEEGKLLHAILTYEKEVLIRHQDELKRAIYKILSAELKNEIDIKNSKIFDDASHDLIIILDSLNIAISKIKDWDESVIFARMNDRTSSLGYRVYMHKLVLTETVKNPLIGSSFMGVWSIFDKREGSTHSQYLDILFRVGLLAFIVYLFFIYKVTVYLYKKELGLFFGFVGFLAVGLLHETIKLSQGAFIFAFLLAMWSQSHKLLKDNEKSH